MNGTEEHVHVRNPNWTGAARSTCSGCGLQVEWRECCDSVAPAEHTPRCPTYRASHPVTSRMTAAGEDDGSTWTEGGEP